MKFITRQIITLLLFWATLLPATVHAQNNSDFFKAEQLQEEQKFEQAYQIFSELHKEDPTAFAFLNKATECLVSIKKYDKAIEITRGAAKKSYYPARANIRLGEIYHISGNKDQAFSIWDKVEQQYADNRGVLMRLAKSMRNRKEFGRSIEIYKDLKKISGTSGITSKLASTYLKAGDYRQAINNFLELVKEKPSRMSYVQQRLIRFRDDYVYDAAIPAISNFLDDLPSSHPSYNRLQQLEVWLLTERKLYKRAVVTAQNAETQSSGTTYILYNLGSKLTAAKKFELAEQAYQYYINNDNRSLKYRCLQELSGVYKKWAQHVDDHNLSLSAKGDSLYLQSYQTLQKIRSQKPNYRQTDEVLTSLAELALDVLHHPDEAGQYLSALQSISGKSDKAKTSFIEGRLHLYKGKYSRARLAFTNSAKQAQIGELAQKSRYYSALTEFYTGNYEFAKLQLNAIERQSNSYFANNAMQLRLWIQDGLKADSTGSMLDPLASAVEHFSQGNTKGANQQLQKIINDKQPNPLTDDALLLWSSHKSPANILDIYSMLAHYLKNRGSSSPLHERLLWERARIADQLVTNRPKTLGKLSQSTEEKDSLIPDTVDQLIGIYEQIILKYPHGFYASNVRDRLNKLKNRPS